MRYVDVGGAHLSVIGLGTWQFGAKEWGYGANYADVEALAITRRALDLGINVVDTAEVYGWGRSERIVGKAIAGRRNEVFLATKLLPVLPVEPIVSHRALSSAQRLGVSMIDLYQVHWPNPIVPEATVGRALAKLLDVGLVANIGVSNFSLEQWKTTEEALGHPVLSNQVRYNLVERKPEAELLPWAQANDRVIIAYSPLAQGLLSGRYNSSNAPGGVRATNPLFLPENLDKAAELIGTVQSVARSHDATPSQVALAWLIRRPNVVAIPGASSVAQLESNAAAADLELSDEQDRELTAASDSFEPARGRAVLPKLARARLSRR